LLVDVGVFDAMLGKGTGEIAAESRSMHKSQGFGVAKTRGTSIEYFKQLKGDSAKKDLFEGIDQAWNRINAGETAKLITACLNKYDSKAPANSVSQLIAIYKNIQGIPP